MDLIKWRTSYETGIPSMDDQHRKIIELINTMYRVMRQTEGTEVLDSVIDEMTAYANGHLQNEEDLLQANGYDQFFNHQILHMEYKKKVEELREDWNLDKASGPSNIYSFLRHWWLGHIVEEDKKYGPLLIEKGVK